VKGEKGKVEGSISAENVDLAVTGWQSVSESECADLMNKQNKYGILKILKFSKF
jgi:phosphoribosylformimino-5-aminoimidazole carboxamide ribonucleotide (ProFAR) isomerase